MNRSATELSHHWHYLIKKKKKKTEKENQEIQS